MGLSFPASSTSRSETADRDVYRESRRKPREAIWRKATFGGAIGRVPERLSSGSGPIIQRHDVHTHAPTAFPLSAPEAGQRVGHLVALSSVAEGRRGTALALRLLQSARRPRKFAASQRRGGGPKNGRGRGHSPAGRLGENNNMMGTSTILHQKTVMTNGVQV